uniref:Uncharacterized protein n=1 Tax=Cacopsylla melanoneura TaxID=428564 RepID=A0A8D9FKU9_9HEMI
MNYIRLCTLTSQVDDCICHLLCLTFIIHLYILCVLSHLAILNKTDHADRVHIIVSFTVTLSRFVALCITTVRVYEESKAPLTVLYGVRHDSYCTEVRDFDILRFLFRLQIESHSGFKHNQG